MVDPQELTPEERQRYEWQMWSPQLAKADNYCSKSKSVLISRIGGVGGNVALQLLPQASAG